MVGGGGCSHDSTLPQEPPQPASACQDIVDERDGPIVEPTLDLQVPKSCPPVHTPSNVSSNTTCDVYVLNPE